MRVVSPSARGRRGSTLSPQVRLARRNPNAIDAAPKQPTQYEGVTLRRWGAGEKGWAASATGRRRETGTFGVARLTTKPACLLPRKLSSVAPTTGGQHRPALIYVFFLPKLNDGLGSELGSGEIWNAEKA